MQLSRSYGLTVSLMLAGLSLSACAGRISARPTPQTYSRLTFQLAVTPDESRAFRERLIDFASRYAPGGWPIGIEMDEMRSRSYSVDIAPDCRHQSVVISDLVRAGAPPERMNDYLSSASATAKCIDGLKVKKSA